MQGPREKAMGRHSERSAPLSWTSSLWNFEKMHLLLKPPSPWHFVVAALTEQGMHILHTEKWRCRDMKSWLRATHLENNRVRRDHTGEVWLHHLCSSPGCYTGSHVDGVPMSGPGWSDYILPLHFPSPPCLCLSPWCLRTVHFGLYWIGMIAPAVSLPLTRVSYMLWLKQYLGSEWAGSANTVAFFFLICINFSNSSNAQLHLLQEYSLIVLFNAAFVVDSWLSSSGKEFLGKDGKKKRKQVVWVKVTMLMAKPCLAGELCTF